MSFFVQTGPTAKGRLSDQLGSALGQGIGQGIAGQQQKAMQQQQQSQLAKLLYGNNAGQATGLPVEVQLALAKQLAEQKKTDQKSKLIDSMFGQQSPIADTLKREMSTAEGQDMTQIGESKKPQLRNLSDEQLAAMSIVDPQTAKLLQGMQQEKRRVGQEERGYHASFTKDIEKKAESLREAIPRKENALDFARNAIESGEIGNFSKDQLANIVGGAAGDLLRTAKGAQLITASKENLLSNMSRVSAKGQNQWFEQKLSSMFPQIGQSEEANKTIQEMIESELAMDKAYLKTFDKLAAQDEKEHGYIRKDVGRRVDAELKDMNKQIFDRATYRMKEIEEQQNGLTSLKKQVGKKVVSGTPLTLSMAKLYLDKFGDKAMDVAKRNGYQIPKMNELEVYQLPPREFRARFENE